jgi:phosphoglucosamine mutase
MARLFGTDGVRGVANRDLTPDLALALGRAAGRVLAPDGGRVVVGRDTRTSGPMLEAALAAGLCSAGASVALAGIVPSPAVAFLVTQGARAGAMVSASHNPAADNGIKFFSAQGTKLASGIEDDIERELAGAGGSELRPERAVGTAAPLAGACESYLDHLAAKLQGRLDGLKVVLDCAHGAAFEAAPRAFQSAGAEVVAIHAEPDGERINRGCGSTHPHEVGRVVVTEGASLGLAFDGDADRVVATDERGKPVDGDRILALLALAMLDAGTLVGNIVVATVMSNMGFRRALEERGVEVVAAPVGDKFVVEAMLERGAVLGGEQSGHVIFGRHATTGDGILTGLQLARRVAASGAGLEALANLYEAWPQVLVNVPIASPDRLERADGLWREVAAAEASLGPDGRVLLRPSGTEPVVRVMVEAVDATIARATADALAKAVARHLS